MWFSTPSIMYSLSNNTLTSQKHTIQMWDFRNRLDFFYSWKYNHIGTIEPKQEKLFPPCNKKYRENTQINSFALRVQQFFVCNFTNFSSIVIYTFNIFIFKYFLIRFIVHVSDEFPSFKYHFASFTNLAFLAI